MQFVLVRYSSLNLKSITVERKMKQVLRQRIVDKLKFEDIKYKKVSVMDGRILVETKQAEEAVSKISRLPGVISASAAKRTNSDIESIKQELDSFSVGETFGVRTNRTGEHDFNSMDVDKEIGKYIEDTKNSDVDLETPETWIYIEVRYEKSFIFTEKIEGPGGFPAGFEGNYATLISGGHDSPVAAFEILKRGGDITPVYFYNKPIAAEDHLLRFEETLKQLKKYHPGRKWFYHLFDMEYANKKLLEIEKGRMLIHRHLMYKLADMLCEKENLQGIVTGEVLGQKSSQTSFNMMHSQKIVRRPIHRPLLSLNKQDIITKSKDLGFFEISKINSACSSLSPSSPATKLQEKRLEQLKEQIYFEDMVNELWNSREKVNF